jgi:peroxiredoxin
VQLGELQKNLASFTGKHASIVAIAAEPEARARAFAQDLGLTYPLVWDPDLVIAHKYGVADEENGIAWPAVFIVAPDGQILWRMLSENPGDRSPSATLLRHLPGA